MFSFPISLPSYLFFFLLLSCTLICYNITENNLNITYNAYPYGHTALASLARALNRADPAGCTALMHACSPIPPSDHGDNEEDEEDGKSRYVTLCSALPC
jgi:hypothetical protein